MSGNSHDKEHGDSPQFELGFESGEAGGRIAREKFSWEVIAADMEHIYRQCLRD